MENKKTSLLGIVPAICQKQRTTEKKGVAYVKKKLQFWFLSSLLVTHKKTHVHKHKLGKASQRKQESTSVSAKSK